MEQRLNIITLGVKDLQDSVKFYEEKLGWERSEQSNDSIVFFELNSIMLSLYAGEKLAEDATVSAEGQGFKSYTLAYLARSKEEVDVVFEELDAKGVEIVKRPQEVFWGGYSGYFADPDGHLWEVAFNPFLTLDEKGDIG